MPLKTQQIYHFGPFRVDPAARVVTRDKETVPLTPKVLDTLLLLLDNRDRVLSKEELMSGLWPDRVVEEANLSQNISVLRKALGDGAGGARFIVTFPGRGYRFVADVVLEERTGRSGPARARYIALAGLVLIGAMAGWWLLRTASRPDAQLKRAPVTRLPGNEFQPAVSPDGTKVAFVWDQEAAGPPLIYLKSLGEDSPRRISSGEGACDSPTFSRDGKRLAYLRVRENAAELAVAGESGGDQKVIGGLCPARYGLTCRYLDWSPDGRFFAAADKSAPNEPFGIFLVSYESGEKRRLTKPDEDIVGDLDPRFSPDGKWITFIRINFRTNAELWKVPAAGGTATRLVAEDRQITGHDWLPDGSSIVFSSDRTGSFELWRMSASGGKPQPAGVSSDFPLQISLARDRPVLAYSVYHPDLNVWRLTLPRPGQPPAWSRLIASTGENTLPRFSPDGSKICFRSDRSGEVQLWVANADGFDPVQVTRGALRPGLAAWSPDGRQLVFNHIVNGELYTVTAAGSERGQLRKLGNVGRQPAFSNDGKFIYYYGEPGIYRIPVSGGTPTRIAKAGGWPIIESSDGKYLYYTRGRTASTIWRVSKDDGTEAQVLEGLLAGYWGCWELVPDGIYYLARNKNAGGQPWVYHYAATTGASTPVAAVPEPLPPMGAGLFSVSRDLRYLLAVSVDRTNSDVVKIEPFR